MGLHVPELTRKYVKDSLVRVLVSNGYIVKNYRGNLDDEILDVDSLGVYEVALDLEEELDIKISDSDIKKMFGAFEVTMENFMNGNGNRGRVKASKVIDYIFEKL